MYVVSNDTLRNFLELQDLKILLEEKVSKLYLTQFVFKNSL